MKDVEIVQLIRVTVVRKGDGNKDNPIRRIIQYYNFDGSLLIEYDPYTNQSIYYANYADSNYIDILNSSHDYDG